MSELASVNPCVCGFGEEFFTMDSGRPVCSVCGGHVGGPDDQVTPIPPTVRRAILIVDDQSFFRERIGEVLREQGHIVLQAPDGLAGVKVVSDVSMKREPGLPAKLDAMVLDLVMPGDLDGFQALAVVKTLLPELPVIILTASPPKKELLQKLARLGAKKYLNKSAANLDTLLLKNIEELCGS